MISFSPPTADSLEEVTSMRQRCDSAKREYMRKISAANRVASSPPVPARISSTTFLSSLGSLGSRRILSSSSIRAISGSSSATSSSAIMRRSASLSCSIGRACARLSSTFFHSRNFATTSERSLCALATLRYCSASPITTGSAICSVSSSKRFSSCSSFGTNCMEELGDDQLAALRSFEGHGAVERANCHLGLIVGRRLRGNALQPQAGRRYERKNRTGPLSGKTDEFIAQPDRHGQQQNAADQLGPECIERNQRVDGNGEEHQHHQEAGAAARMKRGEALGVLHRHRLAGFIIENHFVLGAVILEHAVHVLEPRNAVQESQEDQDANAAIDAVESQVTGEH